MQLLQRQIAWHLHFSLTVIEDLEQAAHDRDEGAACFLMQAFVASCLTMSHHLWPGGRRVTDQLVIGVAEELRASLGVEDGSLLASQRIAPLGTAIRFDRQDCRSNLELHGLTVQVGDETIPLRPVFGELRSLWERTVEQVDRVPSVA
jgi:hypothetical protein